MKILGRIDVFVIFKRHLQTYYDYGEYQWSGKRKVPRSDIFTFLLLPFILSIIMVWLDPRLMTRFASLIATCLSIFIGLLFNLLILSLDLTKKEREKLILLEERDRQKIESTSSKDEYIGQSTDMQKANFDLITELFVNVSYSITLSIFCMFSIIISNFRPAPLIKLLLDSHTFYAFRACFIPVMNAIILFLLIQFILTLLMILRRFFIVFNNQVEANIDSK